MKNVRLLAHLLTWEIPNMEQIVTLILLAVVGFAIIMYVLLDGFDLGIGILFPFSSEADRDIMMSSIIPVWDGNETWLVLGAATLYGAFPLVYSTLLPTLYLPLFLMLLALVFRGVAFEFRHYAHKSRAIWNIAFAAGSTVAAFCQGLVLGTFIQGYTDSAGVIQVSNYNPISAFSLLTGLAVVAGYALLGSTWLIRKTEGKLQQRMYRRAQYLVVVVILFSLIVTLWTPTIDPSIKARWFSMPTLAYLMPLPIVGAMASLGLWYTVHMQRHDRAPFWLTIIIFLCSYVGFALSVWPYIIPRAVTVWQAAAPFKSQIFILAGIAVVLPVILAYTIYSYIVFRGKVNMEHGSHY